MTNLDEHQVIWLGAGATTFAVPCERCNEDRRLTGLLLGESLVEGSLRLQADVGFTVCHRGHRIRVRRIARLRAVAAG